MYIAMIVLTIIDIFMVTIIITLSLYLSYDHCFYHIIFIVYLTFIEAILIFKVKATFPWCT